MTREESASTSDLATLIQWIKEGRQNDVLPHIGKLPAELQPLVDLLLKQDKARFCAGMRTVVQSLLIFKEPQCNQNKF